MPRLVHLARASSSRGIERAGIRGGAALVKVAGESAPAAIERAVFAMPVVPDFAVSYPWLRELRRWHGERMVAAHFVLPSETEVLVGRYGDVHARLSLRDAVRRVLAEPQGSEIVVPRGVRRREIVGIRDVTQLVGWTETPEGRGRIDCVCQVCIPAGSRDLMRRVRASFAQHLQAARKAKGGAVRASLGRLDAPLERARGRLAPDPLFAFAKSADADQRKVVAMLLGYFKWRDVESALVSLLADDHSDVRAQAMTSIVNAGGLARAATHATTDEAALIVLEEASYARDTERATRVVEALAKRGGAVQEKARTVARTLVDEQKG